MGAKVDVYTDTYADTFELVWVERATQVPAEDRTVKVKAEDRTTVVPAEDRTVKIT